MSCIGEDDAQKLELAFSKKKIEERKAWLQGFELGTFLDQSADEISYSDFVDKVHLSRYLRNSEPMYVYDCKIMVEKTTHSVHFVITACQSMFSQKLEKYTQSRCWSVTHI